MTPRYDALIVGARSAGAATAMLAARAGLRVLVIDRSAAGTDTLSSHNLTRGGARQLERWGLLSKVMDDRATPILSSTFHYAGEPGVTVPIRPLATGPGMLAPRRHRLDALMVEAARQDGAEVRFGQSFLDVLRDAAGRVTGARIADAEGREHDVHCDTLVGADGLRSTVARRLGAQLLHRQDHALGHVYGYYAGLPLEQNHGAFAPGVSVGVSPTDDGQWVVISSARPDRLQQELTARGPEGALEAIATEAHAGIGTMLGGARMVEGPLVFRGVPGFCRQSAGPGWALVGDAACFKDPATSHGMTDAFRDAELLANALARGGDAALEDYHADRSSAVADLYALTAEMARFDQTMPELKEQFLRLSRVMRAEQAWMDARFEPGRLAA